MKGSAGGRGDDLDGAEGLRHQEAEPGGGAVEGAQFVHEPLGVQATPSLYPEISHRPVWNRDSGTRPAGTVQTTTPGRAPSSVGGR